MYNKKIQTYNSAISVINNIRDNIVFSLKIDRMAFNLFTSSF